jgi:mRNA interferase HigB
MRVISKARLRQFWLTPGRADSEGPLRAWHAHVNSKTVSWRTWADVKAAFATASIVGNCIVFNIGGNKYRLVTRVLYSSQKVFVLKIMTHSEYDKGKWKKDCGCYRAPPSKSNDSE